jgi:hypothetical protein
MRTRVLVEAIVTWADVVEAAAGGLLDESHWVDLKRELATGKASVNTDLPRTSRPSLSTVGC